MVKMVRGETSYLVDPRCEEHVHRHVPHDRWNLWIGHAEPHKVATAAVTTPWALSVIVPNNEAVLITSRHGRRVVIGPLHRAARVRGAAHPDQAEQGQDQGRPHHDHHLLPAHPGRPGRRQLRDRVLRLRPLPRQARPRRQLRGRARALVQRRGPRQAARRHRARPRPRGRPHPEPPRSCRTCPALVRQALFGEHSHLRFPDNGMVLTGVDLLAVAVADGALAELFGNVQREAVSLQLQDQQHRRRVESTRHRDQIDAEEHGLQRAASQRMAETSRLEALDAHASSCTSSASPPIARTANSCANTRSSGHRRLRGRQPGREARPPPPPSGSSPPRPRPAPPSSPTRRPGPRPRLAEIDQQTAAASPAPTRSASAPSSASSSAPCMPPPTAR
jgi:major vault protein